MKRKKTTHIIIHTAAASNEGEPVDQSAQTIRNYHVNELGWEDIGYHFVIRMDGSIEWGRYIDDIGAHCTDMGMNQKSIGICCSGHGDLEPFTDEQIRSLGYLINGFRQIFSVPIENVLGHRETGANKTCPGKKVDMDKIRDYLKDNTQEMARV